jgi:hypothetical protein
MMRSIKTFLKSQRGQNLALVAGSLLMLFALLMVAVDMGNIYLFRRGLQNSADAAALAGAQNLCFDEGTYDTAYAAAQTYAETYNRGEAGESDIDVDMAEYSVTVTTWDRADNLLVAGIVLGDNGTDIGATAKAACGPTTAPCNLFPVAFPLDQWDIMRDQCGESFYVWAGDLDDTSNGGQQPNCEPYDAATNPDACNCDVDGDGDEDVIAENGRAWVDFTSSVTTVSCAGSIPMRAARAMAAAPRN